MEREISFRTECGLYYSYYKQMLQAPSLLQGTGAGGTCRCSSGGSGPPVGVCALGEAVWSFTEPPFPRLSALLHPRSSLLAVPTVSEASLQGREQCLEGAFGDHENPSVPGALSVPLCRSRHCHCFSALRARGSPEGPRPQVLVRPPDGDSVPQVPYRTLVWAQRDPRFWPSSFLCHRSPSGRSWVDRQLYP